MNYIKDIDLDTYNMVIEIPKGTKSKYELVEGTFDRVQEVRKVKCRYPFYYGCFPQTLAGDGDALDAVLLSNKKRKSLDIVRVVPISIIKTRDNGEIDNKIFVVAVDEIGINVDKLKEKALKFLHKYKGKYADMIIDDCFYSQDMAIEQIKEAHNKYIIANDK